MNSRERRLGLTHHEDLKNLPFPMLSDIKRDLSGQLRILDVKVGVVQRATFPGPSR
jgi:alkyl hydroperoxide reductase subunit AhpC